MFAILETGGKQYKVEEGDVIEVELIDKKNISNQNKVSFSDILLIKDTELHLGQPYVKNGTIEAQILDELKAPKIIVFKKKKRKDYSVKRGHRQEYTEIVIDNIQVSPKKTASKAQKKKEVKAAEIETVESPQKSEAAKTKPAKSAKRTKDIETETSEATTIKEDKKAVGAVKKPLKTDAKKSKTAEKQSGKRKVKKQF